MLSNIYIGLRHLLNPKPELEVKYNLSQVSALVRTQLPKQLISSVNWVYFKCVPETEMKLMEIPRKML